MAIVPGTRRLPRSTPEQQGVSSRALLALVDALVDFGELHSLMVVRHGHVVAEGWATPYSADRPHLMYSLSKSFTSSAIGFARAEGLLDLDDLVLDHFVDAAPAEPGEHLRRMRLRHLLTMTTGHHDDASDATFMSPDWARAFLALPVQHAPGTHFVYNTAATYMLAEIVQRVTGQRLLDYLTPRLLEPLGIEGATWEQSPAGVDLGGFGMSATTEDIAVFGQLYLQDGRWDGVQVLPVGWAAEATSWQVMNGDDPDDDWAQGYGYQFWRGRHGSYRGDGAFGQFCVVVPDLDLLVVTTSACPQMDRQLELVWELLLPGVSRDVLPSAEGASAALAGRLAGLALPLPVGAVSGAPIIDRELTFEPNGLGLRTAMLDSAGALTITHDGGVGVVRVGYGELLSSRVRVSKPFDEEVLAAGAWVSSDVYELTLRLVDGPHAVTLRAEVDGDRVTVAGAINATFGEPRVGPLAASVGSATASEAMTASEA
jgi:CubicO group peptidase (beta-lactamase class C family)